MSMNFFRTNHTTGRFNSPKMRPNRGTRSVHRMAKSDCASAASSPDVGAGRNIPKSVRLWIAQVG